RIVGELGAGRGDDVVGPVVYKDGVLIPTLFILAVEHLEVHVHRIVHLPLHHAIRTLPFPVELIGAPVGAAAHVPPFPGQQVIAGEEGAGVDAIGARGRLRIREVEQYPDLAVTGLPAVAEQNRRRGAYFFDEVTVVAFGRDGELHAVIVERSLGSKVDRTAQPAFDHVGALVLVYVDALQEFRRDVLEAERPSAVGGEAVTAVQFAADHRQATHHYAGTLRGKMLRIVEFLEAGNGDAGYALQRFRHTPIRQLPYVRRNDGVDDLVRIPLDGLRRHDAAPL